MTTLFLAVAFLLLGSLALPMALRARTRCHRARGRGSLPDQRPGSDDLHGEPDRRHGQDDGRIGWRHTRRSSAKPGRQPDPSVWRRPPVSVRPPPPLGPVSDAAAGAANAGAGGDGERGHGTGQCRAIGIWPRGRWVVGGSGGGAGSAATRQAATGPPAGPTDLRHGRRRLAKESGRSGRGIRGARCARWCLSWLNPRCSTTSAS